MELRPFMKIRAKYEKLARARKPERIEAGLADGSFEQWIIEEMLIDFMERQDKQEADMKALKDLLNPQE